MGDRSGSGEMWRVLYNKEDTMKVKRVVLALVLVVLLLLSLTTSVVTADGGGLALWKVHLAAGYALEGVRVIAYEYCTHACNVGGAGYAIHAGHGVEPADCMADASGYYVGRMPQINMLRLYGWGPDSHGAVGELACIHWCCQPYPAMMVMGWEFEEIVE